MTATIIDGRAVAHTREAALHKALTAIEQTITLATVLVGDHPASKSYVARKHSACERVGMNTLSLSLEATITQEALATHIKKLNADPSVHGILVQLPLPRHIDTEAIIACMSPDKDVDGFHPVNIGNLSRCQDGLRPCTPRGIMHLLDAYDIEVAGKHAVVVGASNIVGRPMALELLQAHATVTVCHSLTTDLASHTRTADILISATGEPGLITPDHVKQNAVVIDVGIARLADGTLTGDVQFNEVKDIASFISPSPGGVGPMTVMTLLENTVQAFGRQNGNS